MYKKLIFLLLAMLLLTITASAQQIRRSITDVENYFSSINGYVVSVSGKEIITDLGSNNNVVQGLILRVYRESEQIIHPISGKVLGTKEIEVGKLVVTQVFPDYSVASVEGKAIIQPKDKIMLAAPANAKLVYNNIADADIATIKSALATSSRISESNTPDYTIKVSKVDDTTVYEVVQTDNVIIYSDTVQQNTTSGKNAISNSQFTLVGGAELVGGKYISIAVGRIMKNSDELFAVALKDNAVQVFELFGDFNKVAELKGKFNKLVAVDVADLDDDGVDEIFISNVQRYTYASSHVFKHDGTVFKPIQTEADFLFRSYKDAEGKRKLLGQKLNNDGGYRGEIFNVALKDDKYILDTPVLGTAGKQLFGFTIIPSVEPLQDSTMITIDQSARLAISTFKKVLFTSSDYFGDTFVNTKPNLSSAEMNDDIAVLGMTIYYRPRMEVLDGKYYILVRNEMFTRIFSRSAVFSKSNVAAYDYNFAKFTKVAELAELEPTVTDIYVYKKDGQDYLLTLTADDSWSLFGTKNSKINQYRINIK